MWNLLRTHKDHQVLPVGVQLHSDFVDVEHEGWVDSLQVVGEVVVELLNLPLLGDHTQPVSGRAQLVDEAVIHHVLPQHLSRDCDVDMVCGVVHQNVRRDGLVGLVHLVDKSFEELKNVTNFTWTS